MNVRSFPACRSVSAILLAGTMLAAAPAAAQSVQPPTREEVQREQLDQQLRAPAQPLSVEDGIERAPCPLADPQFADISFTFREARFSGLEAVDPALVTASYADMTGQTLPVAAVCEIRDRAATALRRAGYLASVQIPVQSIEDGVVDLDAVLARMTAVQVRGDAGPSEYALKKYLDKLVGAPVFNINDAERYLLLARDIPGLDVRLTLRPAPRDEGPGAAVVAGDVVGVVNVVRTPVYADVNVQNFGSRDVGRFGGLLRARFNGLTGLGDETTISGFMTADPKEQQVVQASHLFRVGGEGLTFGGGVTMAWTHPDLPGPDPFTSDTLVAGIFASYPVLRTQTRNVLVTGGFDLIDQTIDFSGLPLSQDKLRVGFLRAELNTIDRASLVGRDGYSVFEPRMAFGGSVEIRQGVGILGASDSCGPAFIACQQPGVVPLSRLDADPAGFVLRAQASMDFRPTPLLRFSLRPRAQYSPDALLGYEQISGGNYTVGRGYDPGAVIGDSGYGVQAEIAYGSLMPESRGGIAIQPFAFVDHIGTYTKNVAGDPQTLTSIGGGARATLGNRASVEAFIAAPLERAPLATRRGDVRALLTLTVQLAPWGN
ncbi:ShlB/FhaC/HecB family hemolysin secretion/activation protein [Qipengyuania marisflavi]|uniref:ShlB/FhaC/HecB family hemolysin secretion/activation protein n=2 Tax=Qipengyuania marisflavi TaxID=2486356 RepID=A0A5S3PAI9_9SPHN|nr:ShlB/FhaC/HecB family hemolysin secretion/activation protein [Qipengyuania marisflavi]